jgi:hypothetical protein
MKLQFDVNQGLFGDIKAMIEHDQRAEYGRQIVSTLWRQLGWTHIRTIVSMRNIKNPADGPRG